MPALLYSHEQLLERCDGDEELMEKLILLFTENTPQILDSIRASVANHDADALAAGAHKLLGSLGAFGAARARALTSQLEEQGRRAELEGAKAKLAELEREIEKIYNRVADYAGVLV